MFRGYFTTYNKKRELLIFTVEADTLSLDFEWGFAECYVARRHPAPGAVLAVWGAFTERDRCRDAGPRPRTKTHLPTSVFH